MNCNTDINVHFEGINFNAHAVATKKQEVWLSSAGKQFWQELSQSARNAKLKEVYALCKAALDKYYAVPEVIVSEPETEPETTENDIRIDEANSPNKDEAATDSET